MKAALALIRVMFGFLFGIVALLVPFVLIGTFATIRANMPHGAPTDNDYRFAGIAIGLLTAAFGAGAALLGRDLVRGIPLRVAATGGAGAVTLLLITMMIVGEPLGFGGAWLVAAAAGGLASWVTLRRWPSPQPVAT